MAARRDVRVYLYGLIVIGAVLLALVRAPQELRVAHGQDFLVYKHAAEAMLAGNDPYARGARLLFTYPPVGALVAIPFTWLSDQVAVVLWFAINIALSVWLLRRIFAGQRYGVLLAVLAFCASPFYRSIYLGQINLLLYALILSDGFRLPWLARWRGAATGLAASMKVTPMFLVVAFLAERDWRSAVRMVGAAGLVTGAAFLIRPDLSIAYWFDLLWRPDRVGGLDYADNQSLTGLVLRLMGEQQVATGLRIGVLAACAVLLALTLRWSAHLKPGIEVLTAVGLIAVMLSPISWSHHFIWLVLFAAWLARQGRETAAFVVLGVLAVEPLFIHGPTVGMPSWLGGILTSSYALMTVGASITLILTARRRSRVVV